MYPNSNAVNGKRMRFCRIADNVSICRGMSAASGVLALSMIPLIAISQETVGQSESVIEVITVTAQKREQNLQLTPIAVSAYSEAVLERLRIDSLEEVGKLVPNLVMQQSGSLGGYGGPVILRGITTFDVVNYFDPGVATYVDGIYIARFQGSLFQLFDTERIEVLRGPQGTLFGKNAVGGAINVVSKKPGPDPSYKASVGVGSFNEKSGRVGINFPIVSDKLYGRVSAASQTRDGFMDSAAPLQSADFNEPQYDDSNDLDFSGARLALRYIATDDLTVDWSAYYTSNRAKNFSSRILDTNPGAIFHDELLRFIGDPAEYAYSGGDPWACCGTELPSALNDLDVFATGMEFEWQINDALTFKSLTGYRQFEQTQHTDRDGTPLEILRSIVLDEQHQISQEFQLSGLSRGERLQWIVGVFGFVEDGFQEFWEFNFQGLNEGAQQVDPSTLSPPFLANRIFGEYAFNSIENTSLAVFGQATYALSDPMNLTLGVRYSYDEKSLAKAIGRLPEPYSDGLVFGAFDTTESWDDISPKLVLDYQVNDNAFLYASAAKGYKSGALNGRTVNPDLRIPVDPEILWNYEFGAKTEWFGNRVRTNLAVFRSDYTDMHVNIFNANLRGILTRRLSNAGEATIQGAELEVTAVPIDGLTLRGSFGFLEAVYDVFLDPNPAGTVDNSGNRIPDVPETTIGLQADYAWEIGNGASLILSGNYRYQDEVFFDVENSSFDIPLNAGCQCGRPSFDQIDASLSYVSAEDRVKVIAWVKNLRDDSWLISGNRLEPFGISWGHFNPPRTFGIDFTIRGDF